MKRYHKDIYFPNNNSLKHFCCILNNLDWKYTKHALDRIKIREDIGELQNVLLFIKCDITTLDTSKVFEFYAKDSGKIEKICYRTKYKGSNDIILIIGKRKQLITIYLNGVDDNHITLDNNLYDTK